MRQANRTEDEIVLSDDGYRAALNALTQRGGRWKFKARDWVPDEYDRLERIGLVRCEFGFWDDQQECLRERTISLSAKGAVAAEQLSDVPMPRYVKYSFRCALRRERQ